MEYFLYAGVALNSLCARLFGVLKSRFGCPPKTFRRNGLFLLWGTLHLPQWQINFFKRNTLKQS